MSATGTAELSKPRLVLLGGPPGVGKTSVLHYLKHSIPACGLLDADNVWQVSSDMSEAENRRLAHANVISVMRGYFEAGCQTGILAWVFARDELYAPIVAAMKNRDIHVLQLYLVADEMTLYKRLQERGEPELLEYARSRLHLIQALSFPKIDTSHLTPEAVAARVREHIDSVV